MDYIITDFQEIENLDYKNSAKIVENLNTNSALFILKITEKLNDSSDIQFKVFLKDEVNSLFYTWKKLKESKDIKNVDVKDLYVNSYWDTYKYLEIKYKDFTNGIFKDSIFDTFSDDEKYNREIVWNRFSNFNNATQSKTNLKQKFKNSKYERYFKDDDAINFFFELVKNFIISEKNIGSNFNYIYRKMFEEKLITDIANESDFRNLILAEFKYNYAFNTKFKTMNKIGNLEQKNKIYEYVKQNCSQ